jgi:hypothetical protein
VSLWIRLKLAESPAFARMKAEGKGSTHPLKDSFGKWPNLKLVLIALFGLAAGQAVVWYTGQFYALFFLEKTLKVDGPLANTLVAIALLLATPFFVFWGWLSDKVGRKPIILAGCLLAALTYFPLFHALTGAANPQLAAATASAPVSVHADPADCSLQFDPVGKTVFNSSCDLAKSYLAKAGVTYANVAEPAGSWPRFASARRDPPSFRGAACRPKEFVRKAAWEKGLGAALTAAGYPAKADSALVNKPLVVGILFVLVLLCDHGLRADRRGAGRDVPDQHPLHLDVPALSHRQRLVRRLPAHHGLRHRRGHGQHLLRPLVPGGGGAGDGGGRFPVRPRPQGRGYPCLT